MAIGLKATFTFDQDTARRLAETSNRLGRPKSEIVRDAINEYHSRLDRLTDPERDAMLAEFDRLVAAIPPRNRAEVDEELAEVHLSRRAAAGRG